jgi:alkylhydroperoxidase family enzyme
MNGFWPCLIMGIAAWAAIYNWIVTKRRLNSERRRVLQLTMDLTRLQMAVFSKHDNWEVGEGHARHP